MPEAGFSAREGRLSPYSAQKTVRLNYPPTKVDLNFTPQPFATRLLIDGHPVAQPRLSYRQLSNATLLVLSTPQTQVTVRFNDFEAVLTTDATGNAQYQLQHLKPAFCDILNAVCVSSRGLEKHFDIVWHPSFLFQTEECRLEERTGEIVLHLAGMADGPPDTEISFQATYCFKVIGSTTITVADLQRRGTCSLSLDPNLLTTAGWIYCNASTQNQRLDETKLQFRDLETALEQLDIEIAKTKTLDFQLCLERALVLRDLERLLEATDDLQACFETLDDATPQQILTVTELLKELRGMGNEWARHTLKAVSIKMFALPRLERAVKACTTGSFSADGLERYLSHLPETSAIPTHVLERLLSVGRFDFRLHCVKRLLGARSKVAVDAILGWYGRGNLSGEKAIQILEKADILFVLRCLPEDTPGQWVERLLSSAADQQISSEEGLVCLGDRIWCDAGWGRVERIEEATGRAKPFCFAGDKDVKVYVTLRPGTDAESVVLDTTDRRIHFVEAPQVFTCIKCERYSARTPNLIAGAHNRESHGGVSPAFRRETKPERNLTFFTTRPQSNQ